MLKKQDAETHRQQRRQQQQQQQQARTTATPNTALQARRPGSSSTGRGRRRRPASRTATTPGGGVVGDDGGGGGDDRRCPDGYTKVEKLGSGAFGAVWHCTHNATGKSVAVKQVRRHEQRLEQAALNELRVAERLSRERLGSGGVDDDDDNVDEDDGGGRQGGPLTVIQQQPRTPLSPAVPRLLAFTSTAQDIWLVYEKGGSTLYDLCFDMRGKNSGGQRLYHITRKPFYLALRRNSDMLKRLVRELVGVVAVLADRGLVHSDLKPDNILVQYCDGEDIFYRMHVVDYGSAFDFSSPTLSSAVTPEYAPPEALGLLGGRGDGCSLLRDSSEPHSFDMWSIGAILLELAVGFPLWLAYKGAIEHNGREYTTNGLFAVSGRDTAKIVRKQRTVVQDLPKKLRSPGGLSLHKDPHALDFLSRLLCLDPMRRMSPSEALKHVWLAS